MDAHLEMEEWKTNVVQRKENNRDANPWWGVPGLVQWIRPWSHARPRSPGRAGRVPHDQCHFGSRAYLSLTPSQSVRPSRRGVRRTEFVLYKSQTSPLKETKVSSRPDKGYPTFESFHPLSAGDFCLQILSNSTTHPISGPAGTTLKRSRAAPCPSGWMRHSNASPTRVALPMPWVKWPRQMAGLLRYLTTSW